MFVCQFARIWIYTLLILWYSSLRFYDFVYFLSFFDHREDTMQTAYKVNGTMHVGANRCRFTVGEKLKMFQLET